ncbi:hypothetical protein [Faecalibaculum rodentium]|nr:hypothetical protein [Faecalibaculum rodentium]
MTLSRSFEHTATGTKQAAAVQSLDGGQLVSAGGTREAQAAISGQLLDFLEHNSYDATAAGGNAAAIFQHDE